MALTVSEAGWLGSKTFYLKNLKSCTNTVSNSVSLQLLPELQLTKIFTTLSVLEQAIAFITITRKSLKLFYCF